jgi:hypothetical protein
MRINRRASAMPQSDRLLLGLLATNPAAGATLEEARTACVGAGLSIAVQTIRETFQRFVAQDWASLEQIGTEWRYCITADGQARLAKE